MRLQRHLQAKIKTSGNNSKSSGEGVSLNSPNNAFTKASVEKTDALVKESSKKIKKSKFTSCH